MQLDLQHDIPEAAMMAKWLLILAISLVPVPALAADPAGIAVGDTLRVVYLAGNPVQAVQEPDGTARGISADMAREIARRLALPVTIRPVAGIQPVIDAVREGAADVGFLAFDPSRTGTVAFSQTYVLVQQSFLVRDDSAIRSVADIDRAGQKIGAGRTDSVGLYLGRTLKQATLVLSDESGLEQAKAWLAEGRVDAFGANRQRLSKAAQEMPGIHMLPDNIYAVPQAIILPLNRGPALAEVNAMIDDFRSSGFLRDAIARSGVVGADVAPPGYGGR